MKRKKGGGGGYNWMDTYGDMVTLLLCFFVLLYSISTVDQQKWIQLVQSFNPNAKQTVTESQGNNGPIADPSNEEGTVQLEAEQAKVDAKIEELYEKMKSYIAKQDGAKENISVTKGDGYVFISFNDAIFFKGDSYVLQDQGKQVLGVVAGLLSNASDAIDEVKVLGHTAQSRANSPNEPTADRFLASNRSTVVLVYLQEHCTVEPSRLVNVGYGQWRPIASNDTSANRVKNRRAEILITGLNLEDKLGDSITHYYTIRNPGSKSDSESQQKASSDTDKNSTP